MVLISRKAAIELEANHEPVPELKLKLVEAHYILFDIYLIQGYTFEINRTFLRLNLLGT